MIRRKVVTWRSGLEETVGGDLTNRGVPFRYEEVKLRYTKPVTSHTYCPDYILDNGIVIETKGIFDAADRKKHELIKAQHPGLDIRFVFTRSKSTLTKRVPKGHKSYATQTTYGDWCLKKGFLYADKLIPPEWMTEPNDPLKHAAIMAATA